MMTFSKMGSVLLFVTSCLVVLSVHPSSGQAPAPSLDCNNAIFTLVPCLDFVTNSSVTTVAQTCCQALSTLASTAPICLCEFLTPGYSNQSAQLGVNQTKALELPTICGVPVTPASCAALLGPAVAPELAPLLGPSMDTPVPSPFTSSGPSPTSSPSKSPAKSPSKSPLSGGTGAFSPSEAPAPAGEAGNSGVVVSASLQSLLAITFAMLVSSWLLVQSANC